jgi:protein O-GlcNAc transferase
MSLVKFKHQDKEITMSLNDDVIENHINKHKNFYEHPMLDVIKEIDGRVIDIGSNFGNHTVFYSLFTGSHEVISIEPIWANYRNLCHNIAVNGCTNVKPIYAGVSDKNGFTGFENHGRMSQCTLGGKGSIPVITVDSLNLTNVKLMKIDCEGMEEKALKGAMYTIELSKPEIFIESFSGYEWIEKILSPFGFKIIECYNEAPTYHFSCK